MQNNSKKRKEQGKRLLYYLDLYREVNKRGNALQVTLWLEKEIDRLVEELKNEF